MHRRWMSLPLLTSAVTAFYPYHDGSHGDNERRDISPQPISQRSQDDLVVANVEKVYHKRDNKYSVTLSNQPSSQNALAISQDGGDYSYFSTMSFGSKGQKMYMLIDTGSANTWVMGSTCKSKSCLVHNTFGTDDSTTLNVTTKAWSLAYGTGTVSGVVANDNVKFANFSMTMGFGLASNASDDFNNYPMDGILGLGRATSNELGVPTVMENLKSQGRLAQNVLGIHINRGSDNTKDGELVFGGVNTDKYTGSLSFTKTSNAAAWQIPVDDVFVNDAPCGLTGKTAIIDTGTSYILMPPADAKKLHTLIPGSTSDGETYSVPCNSKANIQVSFSGVKYTISTKDFVGAVKSGNICSSNIVGHQAFGPNDWILGDVFLKNVYSVFDFDQARIGFGMPGSGGNATGMPTVSSDTPAAPTTTIATTTTRATGMATSTKSSTSSTSSVDAIGNPFDASSTSGNKNAATSSRQDYKLSLVMAAAFLVGLII